MRWLKKLWRNNEGSLPEDLGLRQVEALLRFIDNPENFFSGGNKHTQHEKNKLIQEENRILLNVE